MRYIKPLLAVAVTAIGSAFVATFQVADPHGVTASTATSVTAPSITASSTVGAAAVPSPPAEGTASSSSPSTTAPATTATWSDGTYTGSAVREPWGNFQVEATISGGELVNITVVAAPTDGHSNRINTTAIPALTQSAIAAQSSEIDTISGATWTSQSYATSLQAALDAARVAATTSQAAG